MDLFHLKDLRVFVVTTSGSPPSGTNKRQYAEEVWNIYKAITATATAVATSASLTEELTNTNTNLFAGPMIDGPMISTIAGSTQSRTSTQRGTRGFIPFQGTGYRM